MQREVCSPRVLSDELGGHYVVECLAVLNEQHSHVGVPFVQVGKGSVECNRDYVIFGSLGVVCELEWVQGVWVDDVDVSHDQPFKAFNCYIHYRSKVWGHL